MHRSPPLLYGTTLTCRERGSVRGWAVGLVSGHGGQSLGVSEQPEKQEKGAQRHPGHGPVFGQARGTACPASAAPSESTGGSAGGLWCLWGQPRTGTGCSRVSAESRGHRAHVMDRTTSSAPRIRQVAGQRVKPPDVLRLRPRTTLRPAEADSARGCWLRWRREATHKQGACTGRLHILLSVVSCPRVLTKKVRR